jgi:hypothetical protein
MKALMRAVLGLSVLLVVGCAGIGTSTVARLSDLPASGSSLNYSAFTRSEVGHYEANFSFSGVDDSRFQAAARKALEANGYAVKSDDTGLRVTTGERGLRLNTWGAVAGVYSKRSGNHLEVKVIVRITQDFTGTLPEDFTGDIEREIRKVLG